MRLLALLGAASLVPAGPVQIGTGPAGGTVWQVVIPNPAAPLDLRPTVFYLPPGLTAGRRDAHLPVLRTRSGRTLAGLSAGGYGAVDIGLRHPDLFGTLEAWSGSFASPSAAHDPAFLVRREARLLRSLGTRFFLSCGTTRDRATARDTRAFSRELRSLGLPHELWLAPGGHDGSLWRRQLPAALRFALRR